MSATREILADHYDLLLQSFKDSLQDLKADPLLSCLAERSESSRYIVDLCAESLQACIFGTHEMVMQTFISKLETLEFQKRCLETELQKAKMKTGDESGMKLRKYGGQSSLFKQDPLSSYQEKSKVGEVEVLQSSFCDDEKHGFLLRENKRLKDEIEVLTSRFVETQKIKTSICLPPEEIEKLSKLEHSNKLLKEKHDQIAQRLDEAVLMKHSLESHNNSLKNELATLSDSNSQLRRELHQLEVELLDVKSKLAEQNSISNHFKESLNKKKEELDLMKKEVEDIEKTLKGEKRKSASLETELEKIRYTHDLMHKTISQESKSLRDQNTAIRSENKVLTDKIENIFKEYNTKLEDEKKNTSKFQKTLKELENENDSLKVLVDSLQQKVDFFKQHVALMDNQIRGEKAGNSEVFPSPCLSETSTVKSADRHTESTNVPASQEVKKPKSTLPFYFAKIQALEQAIKEVRFLHKQEKATWATDVKQFKLEVTSMVYRFKMHIANRLIENYKKSKEVLNSPRLPSNENKREIVNRTLTPRQKPYSENKINTPIARRRLVDKEEFPQHLRASLFVEPSNKENGEFSHRSKEHLAITQPITPRRLMTDRNKGPANHFFGMKEPERNLTIEAIELESQAILDRINEFKPAPQLKSSTKSSTLRI